MIFSTKSELELEIINNRVLVFSQVLNLEDRSVSLKEKEEERGK